MVMSAVAGVDVEGVADMDFDELIKETLLMREEFNKKSTTYDKRDRVLDLVEEVGELCNAVLIVDGRKKVNIPSKQRTKADIADAISDILFNLTILAKDYEIDMVKDYERMLGELKRRIEEGEYS